MDKKYIFISFLPCLSMSLIGALCGLSIWGIQHQKFPILILEIEFLLPVTGALIIFSYIYSWVPWGTFKSNSLKALNTFAIPKNILWSEITKAKIANILGIKWLRLYTNKSQFAVWLPLNIKNISNLKSIIDNCGNTLVQDEFRKTNL